MKTRLSTILVCGIILFSFVAAFFWMSAEMTHLNCCGQEWVESAPTPSGREERAQIRERHIEEVARLKRQSQRYALGSLVGALGFALVYYVGRRRVAHP